MRRTKILGLGVILAALVPISAFAAGPKAGIAWGKVEYPYKDLPGVTAPKLPQEKFNCSTAISDEPFDFYGHNRFYPRLVYVCEQNGVISQSSRPPNYSYWQYNDRNR